MIKFLAKLSFLAIAMMAACGYWLWSYSQTPLEITPSPQTVIVKSGSNIRLVSRQLVEQQILKEPWGFIVMARLTGQASQLKAGNYLVATGTTPYGLFKALTNGDVTQVGVTFIEGWNFQQLREELNRHDDIEHVGMALSNEELLARIGANEQHPEGLFFPDTYYFSSGMTDLDILQRAYQAMQKKLETAWQNRAPGLPYANPYQALIMASIVEKETGKASERRIIARVFLNRLKIGMRLQTDPTVIYGMGEHFDGDLRRQDLLTDTPYNTYTRNGLPPTPIAMPGIDAIEAALHPADNAPFLYFVGKGDGSHFFSKTLEEHNRAVMRFQLGKK